MSRDKVLKFKIVLLSTPRSYTKLLKFILSGKNAYLIHKIAYLIYKIAYLIHKINI